MNGPAQCEVMDMKARLKEVNRMVDKERKKLKKEDKIPLMSIGFEVGKLLVLAEKINKSIISYD